MNISQRISSISERISAYPILNRIGQDHISSILGATVIDTGVLTLPNSIRDIQNGETAENVFRNAGLDMGKNRLFNIGGEAVSGAIGAVVKRGEGENSVLIDIDKIRPQLRTEPDTAFFWSGRTDGIGGANTAANIAKSKGGVTLESTI